MLKVSLTVVHCNLWLIVRQENKNLIEVCFVVVRRSDEAICTNDIHELDTDWEVTTALDNLGLEEDDDKFFCDNFTEGMSWMDMTATLDTWTVTEMGFKISTRIRYQNRPVMLLY